MNQKNMNQKNVKFTPDCLKEDSEQKSGSGFLDRDQRGVLYLAGILYSAPFFRLDWKVKYPTIVTNLLFINDSYDWLQPK